MKVTGPDGSIILAGPFSSNKIITTSPLRYRKRQSNHPWTKIVLDDLKSHKLIFTKTVNRTSHSGGCWLRLVLCTVDSVQAVNDAVLSWLAITAIPLYIRLNMVIGVFLKKYDMSLVKREIRKCIICTETLLQNKMLGKN